MLSNLVARAMYLTSSYRWVSIKTSRAMMYFFFLKYKNMKHNLQLFIYHITSSRLFTFSSPSPAELESWEPQHIQIPGLWVYSAAINFSSTLDGKGMLVSAPGPPYKEGAVLPGQQHLLGLGPVVYTYGKSQESSSLRCISLSKVWGMTIRLIFSTLEPWESS